MSLTDLIKKNRSCRRFDNSRRITTDEFSLIINNATKVASAANLQNLRYIISNTKRMNDEIFRCLNWAGYLSDWPGPEPEERPSGYIIMLVRSSIEKYAHFDAGIAAQTITLSATELGLGGCLIASINKPLLGNILDLSEDEYSILLCIALGKPIEHIKIEPVIDNQIQYWRDEANTHHVPKRDIEEVIIGEHLDQD
ncbi:nitroreductase family protein [bacterium]|nr:nitroreductase family protein [bacterium]